MLKSSYSVAQGSLAWFCCERKGEVADDLTQLLQQWFAVGGPLESPGILKKKLRMGWPDARPVNPVNQNGAGSRDQYFPKTSEVLSTNAWFWLLGGWLGPPAPELPFHSKLRRLCYAHFDLSWWSRFWHGVCFEPHQKLILGPLLVVFPRLTIVSCLWFSYSLWLKV